MSSSQSISELNQSYLDEYIGYRLTNTAVIFIVLETVLVTLRFWSRRLQKTRLGWDDYLVLPALVFCIGNCILAILAVEYGGVGYHVQLVAQDTQKFSYWYKSCVVATPVIYCIAAALPKLTILAAYLRVFIDRYSRISCYVLGLIIVLNAIINIPVLLWKCHPIAYGWDRSIPGGSCTGIEGSEARLRFASLPNIMTDVAMLVLPIPVIWRLHMSRNTKLGLALTFLTGSIGLITSILRFIVFFKTAAFADGTYVAVELVTWCIVEPGIYLTAACLLAYRPLIIYVVHGNPLSLALSRSRKLSQHSTFPNSRQGTANELQTIQKQKGKSLASSECDKTELVYKDGNNINVETLAERGEYPHNPTIPSDRIHVEHELMFSSEPTV